MRPADAFVSLARTFESQIALSKDAEAADGKSILSIITLAAAKGDQLLIRARGADASQAIDALAELVEQNFAMGETAQASSAEASPAEGDVRTTEENI